MTLINISQDVEFIEDNFIGKGDNHPAAVCKTDFGVAWVNEEGCYLYDGQKVISLSSGKIASANWALAESSSINDDAATSNIYQLILRLKTVVL